MQERKNKKRFISLVVLSLLTLLVFWWIQPENRLDIDQDVFQVDDLNSISAVELISDTSEVTLAYNGTMWRVNDRYRADGDMIRVLFATLQQARPRRTVAAIRRDSIYRVLEESGVKVSLFAGEELKESFFAGGDASKTQAYFADPVSGEVYVMTIPGYRVYVSGILELPEGGWRDKFIFGFNWRNFKTLEARFPRTPAENFTISMDRNFLGIDGLAEADTAKLNTFLDNVSLLTAETFISEPGLSDSLLAETPRMDIHVTDIGNRSYRLRLYASDQGRRVAGIVQDSQVAVFDRRKMEILLKPKSFFRKK